MRLGNDVGLIGVMVRSILGNDAVTMGSRNVTELEPPED